MAWVGFMCSSPSQIQTCSDLKNEGSQWAARDTCTRHPLTRCFFGCFRIIRSRASRVKHTAMLTRGAKYATVTSSRGVTRITSQSALNRTIPCLSSSAQSSRRCLFMNKEKFGVRSPKSTFAVLQRPTIERPVGGSWRVLFRCWWSAPTCPGRSVKIRIETKLC